MLPNEMSNICREELEKILDKPNTRLAALNIEIAYTNSMISVLMSRLESLELKRRELIEEVLK